MRKKVLFALPLVAAIAAAATAISTAATDGASAPRSTAATQITCNKARALSIGIAAPITGPAASIGTQQLTWGRFAAIRWNATHKRGYKIRLVEGDTQLPNVAEAIKVANTFASRSAILGVAGPAGSQEVQDSTDAYRRAGLAFVSGSATRTSLTDGSRRGYFFRVVPTDDDQGASVARYITNTIKAKVVHVIDDQEAYSQGLADSVQTKLRAAGVTVTRDSVSQQATSFAGQIAKVGSNVQVVYIPWQLSSQAQAFGQQLRQAGKNATLFGSDGLFDPSTFKIAGSYVSFFPVSRVSPLITSYKRSHGGKADYFGAPTYEAVHVVALAAQMSCKDGRTSRAEVRRDIYKVKVPQKVAVLSIPIAFSKNGDVVRRRFGIFKIGQAGGYNPVG
jgi:branched-chain amino acid transport system substrate-binding protein